MKIITRAEAITQGLIRYFTGEPCKHGHVAERSTVTCHCVTCWNGYASTRRKKVQDKLSLMSALDLIEVNLIMCKGVKQIVEAFVQLANVEEIQVGEATCAKKVLSDLKQYLKAYEIVVDDL